jgi:excinuclease UvrABC ATPase subunit
MERRPATPDETRGMTEHIEIRGAREHNLADVSLRIPKRAITIFTGVSGSGKSSIVFDTIAAEAQRQLYENFSLSVRRLLPHYPKPDVDAIDGLNMAVIVDQRRLGGGSHSTVGTITDIGPVMRLLFSRFGRPHAGTASAFSFNEPAGMCTECRGSGSVEGVPVHEATAPSLRPRTCPACRGARLNQAALRSRIDGYSIADLASMEVRELIPLLRLIGGEEAEPVMAMLGERLRHLADIGLDYLSLDRETDTLSGGESQRVKMVKQLGSSLVDVIYVLDEPSVGLHPRDVHRLNELLVELRDRGNTVLVVEHDPDVIRIADHVVDMGPGAGRDGGHVVFEGTVGALRNADTLTGRFLDRRLPVKVAVRTPTGWLPIRGARVNNLRGVDVDIPTGVLTVVTGVAGSGKSSLIEGAFLPGHPEAVVIDQSAVGTSTRSNPATYTGVMDDIRKAFAKANGVDAGLFSFNAAGACAACTGSGVLSIDLAFLEGVRTPCEACGGRRFRDEVLAYRLDGRTVSEVLELTISEALDAFAGRRDIVRRLEAMSDVGLDYLALGQPLSTLSGGECQRIKLASQLHKAGNVYVLDEPTTGLHPSDVSHLLMMLERLVEAGNSVIVVEHNLDLIRNADWIIDLGPDGGSRGGELVYAGAPLGLMDEERSLTGEWLRQGTDAAPSRRDLPADIAAAWFDDRWGDG